MSDFIPVNIPLLKSNERRYLQECIDTGWISSEGPFVKRLETEFAAKHGRKHGIAVCNGTAALDVAVVALRLGQGDEVILPSFTIISCAQAITRAGAKPVVVDCHADTWNMNVAQVEARINPRTKAIMVVHLFGLPVDMDPILALAKKHDLAIIEDTAQAIGMSYHDRPCGSFGDVSTFSFYPNKHITTGEGGMVACNDDALAERCAYLRNLCFDNSKRFQHEELGWNYRMSNMQAAVGVAQLEQLDQHMQRKRAIGKRYQQQLDGIQGLQLPLARTDAAENAYWVFGMVLDDDVAFDAAEAMQRLAAMGVGCRPFFWGMHEQPVFHRMGLFVDESLPVCERIARRGFYVPSGLALTDDEIDTVSEALHRLMKDA